MSSYLCGVDDDDKLLVNFGRGLVDDLGQFAAHSDRGGNGEVCRINGLCRRSREGRSVAGNSVQAVEDERAVGGRGIRRNLAP